MKLCTSAYQICTHLHLDECVKFLSLTLPDPKWNMCLSSSSHTTVKNSKNFNSPFPQIELWSILSAVYYGTMFRSCKWSYWGLRSVFTIQCSLIQCSVFQCLVFQCSVFQCLVYQYLVFQYFVLANGAIEGVRSVLSLRTGRLPSKWVVLAQN